MARTFRQKRSAHPIADLNVTNLIDLGFTLLIIFMIATPLINQEQSIPVNLPKESKNAQIKPSKDTKFVSVTIDGKGSHYIDTQLVAAKDLGVRLKAIAASNKDVVVKLRADGGVAYQKVVTVMDELKKAGLFKVEFDTQAGE